MPSPFVFMGESGKVQVRKSLELKEMRHRKLEIANDIANQPLDEDKRKMLDQLYAEISSLNADIQRYEFLEENLKEKETTSAATPSVVSRIVDPEVATAHLYKRNGKLKAFKNEKDAYTAGMWLLGACYNYQKGRDYCAKEGLKFVAAANEGVGSQGGFLVPDILETTIIDLRESYGLFRQYAQPYTMGSDHIRIPRRASGLTAYAVAEQGTITDSTKGWNQVELVARKWAVLAKYSSEVAEDAIISIAENLTSEAAYALALAEDTAGFNGDGSGTYHGITGIVKKFDNQVSGGTSTFAGALDAASGHDTFAEFDLVDITNLMGKLPQYAWPRAAWYISQTGWAVTMQRLAATAGGVTKQDIQGPFAQTFLGYPVRITQAMRTTTGDLSDVTALMFGDLAAAVTFGSRRGITVASSVDRYFETDELAIRVIERFDINVHDIGDTTTAGPVVALIGE